jgi:hypothetical protein
MDEDQQMLDATRSSDELDPESGDGWTQETPGVEPEYEIPSKRPGQKTSGEESAQDIAYNTAGRTAVVPFKRQRRSTFIWCHTPNNKLMKMCTLQPSPPIAPSIEEIEGDTDNKSDLQQFLTVGISPRCVAEVKNKASKNEAVDLIPADAEAYVVVVPAKATDQVNFYALHGLTSFKEPWVINSQLVFYFAELSMECPLPSDTPNRPTAKTGRKRHWNACIAAICGRKEKTTFDSAKTPPDFPRHHPSEEKKLVTDIVCSIASVAISVQTGAKDFPSLTNLLEILRIRFPGIEDRDAPTLSLHNFFGLDIIDSFPYTTKREEEARKFDIDNPGVFHYGREDRTLVGEYILVNTVEWQIKVPLIL